MLYGKCVSFIIRKNETNLKAGKPKKVRQSGKMQLYGKVRGSFQGGLSVLVQWWQMVTGWLPLAQEGGRGSGQWSSQEPVEMC